MKETTKIKDSVETESAEAVETVEMDPAKPYTFRKLSSDDMFLMFSIIKKIGLKEFKACFEGDSVKKLIASLMNSGETEKDNSGETEKTLMSIGFSVGLDALDVLLGNIPKCKEEIYQLLSQTSNMSEEEIRSDALLLVEMVIDFFKKAEFPAFIKVVSKLFR